ncbi:MAG: hypothetical protein ACYDBZ_10760 [Steroidobacteraceae bacterium]
MRDWKNVCRRAASLLGLVTSATALSHPAAARPAIWLAPVDDQVAPAGFQVDQDYQALFQPNAPWQSALSRIAAFEMTRRYATTQQEANLRTIFDFLRQHHIPIGLEAGLVPAREDCGNGVEGTAHRPDENVLTARRLKRLGAEVKYIVMDEPLTYGHFFNGRNACHYSMNDLAAGVAGEIKKFRDVLPDIQVVEDEALSGIGSPDELGQWLDALKAQLGPQMPVTIHFDVQWDAHNKPWQQLAEAQVKTVLRHGYRFGIIFDGNPQDQTDEAWIRTAESHIKAWEGTIRELPDHVVIQSWHPHPTTLLPETGPTTLTYLVNWYCENSKVSEGCK